MPRPLKRCQVVKRSALSWKRINGRISQYEQNDADVGAEKSTFLGKCPGGVSRNFLFHFPDHWHHHYVESAPSTVHGTDIFVIRVQHCNLGDV